MHWKRIIALGLLLVLIMALLVLAQGPLSTLRSLRLVDDYPLYVMNYRGSYLFSWYLKQGVDSAIFRRLEQMNPSVGCTTFMARTAEGEILFGRNFDWEPHPALILFADPPDGYASATMVDMYYLGYRGLEQSWTQRLYLLFAPYVTVDGMNEHGLAVSMMEVPCRPVARDAAKTTIVSSHVMRLVLDRARDVDEALALLEGYNVYFPQACTHYLFADASGRSAVVEYAGDQIVITRNDQPWQVATNFIVSEEKPQGANSSCWRYNGAYETLEAGQGVISRREAMSILDRASQPGTIWSAVYNLTSGEIDVVVGRDYPHVQTFKLGMQSSAQ